MEITMYQQLYCGNNLFWMFYQEEVHEEDNTKQETPGVEESAVIVVECTTVKEEVKEENLDTEVNYKMKQTFL